MITLDYVLKSKNANGEVYLCDVSRFFEITDMKKARDMQRKLSQLQKVVEKHGVI